MSASSVTGSASVPKARTRVLSQIEFSEKLKRLSSAKRLIYALLTAVLLVAAFVGAILLAMLLMALVSALLGSPIERPEQVALMAIPIIGAMMIAIGFGGSSMPESVLPGDTLMRTARRAARSGLISGALVGFFFGMIWGTAIRIHLIVQSELLQIEPGTLAKEILIFGVLSALVIAPCFALFRAFSSINGMLILDWFDRQV
ncbi:MAG TPA: hypothetical protein VHL11_13825 [Phototrophicaceae bacterium]|jgi:hypothetical protein|nr:hypothetical protein [Phototrophicaceae bacterium]